MYLRPLPNSRKILSKIKKKKKKFNVIDFLMKITWLGKEKTNQVDMI